MNGSQKQAGDQVGCISAQAAVRSTSAMHAALSGVPGLLTVSVFAAALLLAGCVPQQQMSDSLPGSVVTMVNPTPVYVLPATGQPPVAVAVPAPALDQPVVPSSAVTAPAAKSKPAVRSGVTRKKRPVKAAVRKRPVKAVPRAAKRAVAVKPKAGCQPAASVAPAAQAPCDSIAKKRMAAQAAAAAGASAPAVAGTP
jgi:hypothetical protein